MIDPEAAGVSGGIAGIKKSPSVQRGLKAPEFVPWKGFGSPEFCAAAHERKVPSHICLTDRHSEEETQRHNRAVDSRWTHAGLRLMQLKAAKILRCCCLGRATEENCESLDVSNIVVARLRRNCARSCLRSCVGAMD